MTAIFAALWLLTLGLYLIRPAGYDAALDQLRDAQRAHVDMAADLAAVRAERDSWESLTHAAWTFLDARQALDAQDLARLALVASPDEIAWGGEAS